jgi:hypothetical protein
MPNGEYGAEVYMDWIVLYSFWSACDVTDFEHSAALYWVLGTGYWFCALGISVLHDGNDNCLLRFTHCSSPYIFGDSSPIKFQPGQSAALMARAENP